MTGISVIICTYNPDKYIFERVLRSIATCELPPGLGFECLVIDNNSEPQVSTLPNAVKILKEIKAGRVIVETNQGLTRARKRGIQEAAQSHLMFIDDDNEIDKDYFLQAYELVKKNPSVAAWNAGVIRVVYIGKVGEWFEKYGKSHFQESDIPETIWSNDSKSFTHWPFGTGLLIAKDVCDHYVSKVEQNVFTLTDRNGRTLASGGDGQMVACAIEMGYSVGRAKELRLNHLIASRKATLTYLTKVDYGIYFSGELFIKETLPDNLKVYSSLQELKLLFSTFIVGGCKAILKNDYKKFLLQRAVLLGRINGNRYAHSKKSSWLLNKLSKRYFT